MERTQDLIPATGADTPGAAARSWSDRYREVRAATEALCEGLAPEDYVVQTMTDVSPTKWHLAHTSWFFETFLLNQHVHEYRPPDPMYPYLFNSYYMQAGERHCRDKRGYLSRPTVAEVFAYRRHVDEHVLALLERWGDELPADVVPVFELGLNHEQQHQELMLTDIKHVFAVNPLRPAYRQPPRVPGGGGATSPGNGVVASRPNGAAGENGGFTARAAGGNGEGLDWIYHDGGLFRIGHEGPGFAFDNEGPAHTVYVQPFLLADRLVTNGEYLEFMEDGGYRRPELWLSLGWATREQHGWAEPFYWEQRDGRWWYYTLHGMREVEPAEPVVHLSYFEADAYARWAGARLPTEFEWEVAARGLPIAGNFVESGRPHPAPVPDAATSPGTLRQVYGDVWEWTSSQYSPYPGFKPAPGAIGEYNGKFMCNQFVLRGGSCVSPADHLRATYRNFFPPDATWQFTGLRLARDAC